MWGGVGGLQGCDPGGQRCSGGQELISSSSPLPEPPDGRWENLDIKDVIEGWNLPICLCKVEVEVGKEEGDKGKCYCLGKIKISWELEGRVEGFYMDHTSGLKRAYQPLLFLLIA